MSINLFGSVADRRREFGLRRTQGATRSTIAALVTIEVGLVAVLGSTVGGLAGVGLVAAGTSTAPDPLLVIAVTALVALAGLVGSAPAAVIAAFREPLHALR